MSPSSAPGRRFAKVGPQMGQFWAVLRRNQTVGRASEENSFTIWRQRSRGSMVPFPRTKKLIPV